MGKNKGLEKRQRSQGNRELRLGIIQRENKTALAIQTAYLI